MKKDMPCIDIFANRGKVNISDCVMVKSFISKPCDVHIESNIPDEYLSDEEIEEIAEHKAVRRRSGGSQEDIEDEKDLSRFGVTRIFGVHVSNFNTFYILGYHEEASGVQIMEFLYDQSIYGGVGEILSLLRMSFVSYNHGESNILLTGYSTTDADTMLACVFVGDQTVTRIVETVTLSVVSEHPWFYGSFLENNILSLKKNHDEPAPEYFGSYKYSMREYGGSVIWAAPASIWREIRENGEWVRIYKDDVKFFEVYDYDKNFLGYVAASLTPLDDQYDWYAYINTSTRLIINGAETEDHPMEYAIGHDGTTEVVTDILVNNSMQSNPDDGTHVLAKYGDILITLDMWTTIKIIKKTTDGYFVVVRGTISQMVDTYSGLYSAKPQYQTTKGQVITSDGMYIILNHVRNGPVVIVNIDTGAHTTIPYVEGTDQTLCRGVLIRTDISEPKITQQNIADLF